MRTGFGVFVAVVVTGILAFGMFSQIAYAEDGRDTLTPTITPDGSVTQTITPTITQSPTPTYTATVSDKKPTQTLKPAKTKNPEDTATPTPTITATQTPVLVVIQITKTEKPSKTPKVKKQKIETGKLNSVKGNPVNLQDEIDLLVDSLWDFFVQKQTEYHTMGGRYFQGLDSHLGVVPVDGAWSYPSGWFTNPTDQQYQWADLGVIEFDHMSFSLRFDVYDGPEGAGWVACYRTLSKGSTWERCRNHGPESLRNTQWAKVKP